MAIAVTVMSLDFESFKEPLIKKFSKKEITIGRGAENDLVLDSPEISSQHIRLGFYNGASAGAQAVWVTDLGSTNGTHLGSTRLVPHVRVTMSPTDRLRIGNYLLKPSLVPDQSVTGEPSNSLSLGRQREGAKQAKLEAADKPEKSPQIQAQGKGFTAEIKGKVTEGDIKSLNLTAKRLCKLSGVVTHRGKPLGGVTIEAGGLGRSESDGQGLFCFLDIVEGTSFALTAAKENFKFELSKEHGTLKADMQVQVKATRLYTITGKVLHNGKPLAGVEIDGGALGKTISGEDGSYGFNGVPEDTEFALKAAKDGFLLMPAKGSEAD